jgi:hypothetical protein
MCDSEMSTVQETVRKAGPNPPRVVAPTEEERRQETVLTNVPGT